MRTYTTALTGWGAAVIGFDALWRFTELDVMEVFFLAMCIGFVAAVAFLALTDYLKENKRKDPDRPVYIHDDETNLDYMPMRKGRVA